MDALRRTEGAEISGHMEGTTGHLKMYGHRSTLHWISLVGLENSVRLNGGPMKQGAALFNSGREVRAVRPDRDGRSRLGVVVVAAVGGTCGLVIKQGGGKR